MKYLIIIVALSWVWLIYESFVNAETIDENGNIIDKKEIERNKKYH